MMGRGESCAVLFGQKNFTTKKLHHRVHGGTRGNTAELRAAWTAEGGCPHASGVTREIHEHSGEGARRDAPGGRSVFAGMGIHEFVCRAGWTADGGSGVEPGSVLFAELFANGNARNPQSGAEADAGESAAVLGDGRGAEGGVGYVGIAVWYRVRQ